MSVLGLRCSSRDFTYAVMSGTKTGPTVQHTDSITIPKNFARPRVLYWMVQEIEGLIARHDIDIVVMKADEGRARGKPYEERVELEGAVYAAAGRSGKCAAFKKRKNTIAKDLGLKGRARYLQTSLDTSVIPGFDEKSEKERDAILSGWSEL